MWVEAFLLVPIRELCHPSWSRSLYTDGRRHSGVSYSITAQEGARLLLTATQNGLNSLDILCRLGGGFCLAPGACGFFSGTLQSGRPLCCERLRGGQVKLVSPRLRTPQLCSLQKGEI